MIHFISHIIIIILLFLDALYYFEPIHRSVYV